MGALREVEALDFETLELLGRGPKRLALEAIDVFDPWSIEPSRAATLTLPSLPKLTRLTLRLKRWSEDGLLSAPLARGLRMLTVWSFGALLPPRSLLDREQLMYFHLDGSEGRVLGHRQDHRWALDVTASATSLEDLCATLHELGPRLSTLAVHRPAAEDEHDEVLQAQAREHGFELELHDGLTPLVWLPSLIWDWDPVDAALQGFT